MPPPSSQPTQPTATTPPSPHASARAASTTAWRAVIIGDIPAAITCIREAAPSLLEDDEFRCALLTAHVVDLLGAGDRAAALHLLRSELASLALAASPEAYAELRKTLLLFTEAPLPPPAQLMQGDTPPSTRLWAPQARADLAGRVARSMRAVTGAAAHPPYLVAAVRYLCLCARAAAGAPGVDPLLPSLASMVADLAGDRLTPPDPPPSSSGITVAEAEVQALRQVLGVPRDAAAGAVRAAGGVAATALRVELDGRASPPGGEDLLTELAWEHAAARGLGLEPVAGVVATAAAAAAAGHAAVHRLEAAAVAGDVDTVEAELAVVAPDALTNAPPAARFELAAARFRGAAARGDSVSALKFLRETLAPLADAEPALLPAVKAAAASLLPGGRQDEGACAPPHLTTTTALRAVLRAALHVPPPRLPALLATLMTTHTAWFRAQRWPDMLEGAAGLPALRATGVDPWRGLVASTAATTAFPAGLRPAMAFQFDDREIPRLPVDRPTDDDDDSDDAFFDHERDDDDEDDADARFDRAVARAAAAAGQGDLHVPLGGRLVANAILRGFAARRAAGAGARPPGAGAPAAPALPPPPPPDDAVVTVMEFAGVDRARALELLAAHGTPAAAVAALFP